MKPQHSMQGYSENKIYECYIKGGLNKNTQKMGIYYYPPTDQFTAKLVLKASMVDSNDVEVERPLSIRFDNFFDVQELTVALQKAKVFFGKKKAQINQHNADFRKREDHKMVEESYKNDAMY